MDSMDQDVDGTMTDADYQAEVEKLFQASKRESERLNQLIRSGNVAVIDIPVDEIIDWKQDGKTEQ